MGEREVLGEDKMCAYWTRVGELEGVGEDKMCAYWTRMGELEVVGEGLTTGTCRVSGMVLVK
jgi:hypothetical protein